MPYGIGQYRKKDIQYSINLLDNFNIDDIDRENAIGLTFTEKIGSFPTAVNNQNCYYLYFKVKKQTSKQIFYLKLINIDDNDNITSQQLIDTYEVEQNTDKNFEVILSPNSTYNKIIWELQRGLIDTTENNTGRIMDINVLGFTQLIDILPTLRDQQDNNISHLTKIGVQGPPLFLMCINREPIRIGRNGIYELNNGININSISFVPVGSGDGKLDYFIMDYEY